MDLIYPKIDHQTKSSRTRKSRYKKQHSRKEIHKVELKKQKAQHTSLEQLQMVWMFGAVQFLPALLRG